MTIRLYNTAARALEDFAPRDPPLVRMYSCGPTVYASPHIGNFRSFLTADLLRRHLEARGYEVHQVMNITDVGHLTQDDVEAGEDKMLQAVRREKLDIWDIARKYEREFMAAAAKLRFRPAQEFPRATEHIAEMIELIQGLLDKGYAYTVDGNVYFEQAKFANFGALSGKKIADLEEGARVEVNPEKRDARDFALWKTDAQHLMQWDAPWGRGFPGWHIECSAMSRRYLGDRLDIHTGGEDNIFPHHECEIAQSEAFTGKEPFVRYWVHTRHLLADRKKMAKRFGNFYTIEDLLAEGWSGVEIRFALMRVHYRIPMNFTKESLEEARKFLARIRQCRARLLRTSQGIDPPGDDPLEDVLVQRVQEFGAALDEDLNMSEAIAVVSGLVSDLNRRNPSAQGALRAQDLFARLDDWTGCIGEPPRLVRDQGGVAWAGDPGDPRRAELVGLALEREAARQAGDFSRADQLRDRIHSCGFKLVDTADGPRIEPAC